MAGTEADIGGGVANLEASPLMELLMDDLTTSQVDGNNTQGKAIWQVLWLVTFLCRFKNLMKIRFKLLIPRLSC